jgi:hypothetical protein
MNKLKELFNDHQIYHSKFQQDYFITVKSGGTLYGQYKQSLRELYSRYNSIKSAMFGLEKHFVNIEEQKYIAETSNNIFKKKRADIETRELESNLETTHKSLEDQKREFTRFYQQACWYKEQLGELTDEKRDKLDKEMWIYKIKEMIALDFASGGQLKSNTYELINSTPQEVKTIVLKELKNPLQVVEWYEKTDVNYLPKEFPKLKFNEELLLLKEFDNE